MKNDIIPYGVFEADLSDSQKAAILHSIELGRELQRVHPNLAEDYRKGLSLMDIVRKYDIARTHGIGKSTANNAVHMALAGYNGRFDIFNVEQYEGLIPEEEMKHLGKVHNSETGQLVGLVMKEEGKGIHAISLEERKRIGRASGLAQYARGIGIHSQTPEERRQVIVLGQIAKGNTPWSDEEIDYAISLGQQPAYQRKTRLHAKRIAAEVNQEYHKGETVRTPRNVTKLFSDIKRGERHRKEK